MGVTSVVVIPVPWLQLGPCDICEYHIPSASLRGHLGSSSILSHGCVMVVTSLFHCFFIICRSIHGTDTGQLSLNSTFHKSKEKLNVLGNVFLAEPHPVLK